ncbi:hypothetical protein NE237_005982 [Protea cynaroides]|uniref:Uncharacterized protein n=1 Tax=Protea cynaroides TaxID=273540 RepID=A0A9Q0QUW2_9MAGN|nr:hypothetical protein NE237_005982 [Protea cynaroides]
MLLVLLRDNIHNTSFLNICTILGSLANRRGGGDGGSPELETNNGCVVFGLGATRVGFERARGDKEAIVEVLVLEGRLDHVPPSIRVAYPQTQSHPRLPVIPENSLENAVQVSPRAENFLLIDDSSCRTIRKGSFVMESINTAVRVS